MVTILNNEGFEVLAGELLSEIGLGREVREPGDFGAPPDDTHAQDPLVDLPTRREAIPGDEQLGHAVRLIRLRLVEPVRRLAEAERIAGRIQDSMEPSDKGSSVRVAFIPVADGDPEESIRKVPAGDQEDADELARILAAISPEAE
ncbi:hypothetical protein [Methylobacterium sp. Leaf106]|uniref:hypothetical protein n=1 Tax=Methylobacterium sp. Leaf106 TaxID=1736255 RepID=UPI0012E83D91|nr:hypothetical protein [Methylobacterium sp. Leaf106]